MRPLAAVIARDQRILAGYHAGASLLDLTTAEEVDLAVVSAPSHAVLAAPQPA